MARLILARKCLIFRTIGYRPAPGQTAPFDHLNRSPRLGCLDIVRVDAVRRQPAAPGEEAIGIECGQTVAGGEGDGGTAEVLKVISRSRPKIATQIATRPPSMSRD